MKITILLIVCALTTFGIQAQSKKVINRTLLTQLSIEADIADSIKLVHAQKKNEVRRQQSQLLELGKLSMNRKKEEANLRSDIRYYHANLKSDYNFDANSLFTLTEINEMISPASVEGYLPDQTILTQTILLADNPAIIDVSEEKVKVQNQMLQNKIDEFKAVNAKNLKSLKEEERLIADLKNAQTNFSKVIEDHRLFNLRLSEKYNQLAKKYEELEDIRQEQERLKIEKELALANKKRGKNQKFDPPVVVDEIPMQDEYFGNRDTKSNQDFSDNYWIEGPPPPPMQELPSPPVILEVVEVSAEFPGGREAMMKFLNANLKIPEVAKEMGINGKCYLKFVISEAGNISNVKVVKGVSDCPECDKEAIRVVKSMPNWTPAKNNGKAVNSWFTLPVVFKVQ